jgi:Gas vesicle protein G
VGVIKEMALLPVAPLRLTVWVADKVAEQVDHEQNSPQARVRRLREIEDARARGELDEEQAAELEARVLEQAGAWAGYRG